MVLPNLTAQSIYMNYYNELNQISDDARCFVPAYRHRKLEPLVENYFKEYLGQFPAQVFDKINEKLFVALSTRDESLLEQLL